MISLSGLKILLWGTPTAKWVTISIAAVVGVLGYGQYKHWQGGKVVTAKIIIKSNKVAKKKHKRVRKRKEVIRRAPASDNRKRLLEKFARSAAN